VFKPTVVGPPVSKNIPNVYYRKDTNFKGLFNHPYNAVNSAVLTEFITNIQTNLLVSNKDWVVAV